MKNGEGTGNCVGEGTGASDSITVGSALGAGIGKIVECRLGSSVECGVLVVGANLDMGIDGSTYGLDDGSTDGLRRRCKGCFELSSRSLIVTASSGSADFIDRIVTTLLVLAMPHSPHAPPGILTYRL